MSGKLTRNDYLAAFEAFSMYLLTGAACIVLGSSMTQLIAHYESTLTAIAVFTSAFSLGRLVTVFATGYLAERIGVKSVFAAGTLLLAVFLAGVPLAQNYYLGIIFCILGGAGMGAQDACCPVILSTVFPKSYASAMSAGQALFCAGCFLMPLLTGLFLARGLSFTYAFYAIEILAVFMLAVLPFVKLPAANHAGGQGENPPRAVELRSRVLGYFALIVSCMAYCGLVNTINTFTTTFGESIGLSAVAANSLLSAYNFGCMVGSVVFIFVLRRVKSSTVLWGNTLAALVLIGAAVLLHSTELYFAALFLAGCFLGVLFGVFITLATGLNPRHPSLAAAVIAVACGLTDTFMPVAAGAAVSARGGLASYHIVVILLVVSLVAGLIFRAAVQSDATAFSKEGKSI